MSTRSEHDETDHSNSQVSTRRPYWSSRQEHLRHPRAIWQQDVEDADVMHDNTTEEDTTTESDEVSTLSELTTSPLPMINLHWINTPRVNTRGHVHEMSLHAFLHHPRVSCIEVIERCCNSDVSNTKILQWNTLDDITPKYVAHSMSSIVYKDDTQRHEERITNMVNNWTFKSNFQIVASTIGVYDNDNGSVSVLDMIIQDVNSKELSIAFVVFEDSVHTWRERLKHPESKLQILFHFAKYNQLLLLHQYNICATAYLLATSSVQADASQFEFEFRISNSYLI